MASFPKDTHTPGRSRLLWRRALGIFISALLALVLAQMSRADSLSVRPSAPACAYTNGVVFDFAHTNFHFLYGGADGGMEYEYAPTARNGSLQPLRCKVNGSYVLRPSNYGGCSLIVTNAEVYPWSSGVTFQPLDFHAETNTLCAKWKMSCGGSNLVYTYRFSISGRTLTLDVEALAGSSGGYLLDRCENASSPVVIHIPCLPHMNVLFAGGLFVSLFADWEYTAASTLYPLDSVFSSSSVYFAHQARYLCRSDGTRNALREKIYLTASPTLDDVLPSIPNPTSPCKSASAKRLLFDDWQTPFSSVSNHIRSLRDAGVSNVWVIEHCWQNGGYDNKYPDVLPAKASYGGDAGLAALGKAARDSNYLFALHENYVDFYTNAASWTTSAVALTSTGALKTAWYNSTTQIQSYQLKPSSASNFLAVFAPQIHSNFTTTASFLDVHSAANPSGKVDYDASVSNAAMFVETMRSYRDLARQLRAAHQGPVSGEGSCHLFYVGYFDDIEAQLNCGGSAQRTMGVWLPPLVNFDLLKLHDKALLHGVGYYERYFCDTNNAPLYLKFSKSNVLAYMAAELAYGHGGFIPTPDRVYDYVDVAKLEQRHLLPAQRRYASAKPVSILYRDPASNDLLTASDYIRRYPTTFDKLSNACFMGQVRVTYDNGTAVCVNRHPSQLWSVQLENPDAEFNFNAVVSGVLTQGVSRAALPSYVLPATNGWVVLMPKLPPPNAIYLK